MLTQKHSSFVCRLNGHRAQHSHNVRHPRGTSAFAPLYRWKPTVARRLSGASRLRPNAAVRGGDQRPRRGCGAVSEQRRRGGRQGHVWPGPQSGKRAPDIEVSNLGHFKMFFS